MKYYYYSANFIQNDNISFGYQRFGGLQGCLLLHAHTSRLGSLHVQLSGLLGNSAEGATPRGHTISTSRTFNSVLLSDLSSNGNLAAEGTAANGNPVSASTFVFFNGSLLVGDLASTTDPADAT